MKFNVITIFPHIFDSYLNESILKRAQKNKLISVKIHNLRDFAKNKHNRVDDRPFGGGPGMVMQAEPIIKAVNSILKEVRPPKIKKKDAKRSNLPKIILFAAAGKKFDEKMARELAKENQLIMISGRYEGIDERIKKVLQDLNFKVREVSIGPYVLTGGELPAMVLIDSISRKIPGVLGKHESLEEKRLGVGVPAYTRPEIFEYKGKKYKVPKTLLSGNHVKIEEWRRRGKKSSK